MNYGSSAFNLIYIEECWMLDPLGDPTATPRAKVITFIRSVAIDFVGSATHILFVFCLIETTSECVCFKYFRN